MALDLSSGPRTYREVATDLEQRARAGEFTPGTPIPAIRGLAESYGVAPMTVRRALTLMRKQGRLRTVPRVGSFIHPISALDAIVLVSSFKLQTTMHDVWQVQYDTLSGAQQVCVEEGLTLITACEKDAPERFLRDRVGFLLMLSSTDAIELGKWMGPIMEARAPFVSVGYDNGLANYINRDDDAACRKALQYLHDLGHLRIALLPRQRGARRPDLTPREVPGEGQLATPVYPLQMPHPSDVAGGVAVVREGVRRALSETAEPPTAMVCGTGDVVSLALDSLAEVGLRVPEDVSVVGYCREIMALWRGRNVTRVDNPRRSIACMAARELIRMGEEPGYQPGRRLIEPDFFEGDTAAPPPEATPTRSGDRKGAEPCEP